MRTTSIAAPAVASHLAMDLGHQGTCRIHDPKVPRPGLLADRSGNAVCAEDHDASARHLVELVDEHRPGGSESGDNVSVVHDRAPHVDRRREDRQGTLDGRDGPHDAGAEPARRNQDDALESRSPARSTPVAVEVERARPFGSHRSSATIRLAARRPETIAVGTPVPGCVLAPAKYRFR